VVILAYAVGLEDFDDRDGDNTYTPFVPADDVTPLQCNSSRANQPANAGADCFYDLADAFLDANKDGISNSVPSNGDTDILIPYRNPALFSATGDLSRGTAHIRASTVIYLSQSSSLGSPTAWVPLADLSQENSLNGGGASSPFVRLRPICPAGTPVPQATISAFLEDGIGNYMGSGTSVSAVDPSSNISTGGFRPASVLAIGARAPNPVMDLPNLPKVATWLSTTAGSVLTTGHSITIRGVEDNCSGDGSFAMQVTSPRGGAAITRILREGDSRGTGSGAIGVRYRDANGVTFTATPTGSSAVSVAGGSFVSAAGRVTGFTSSVTSCGNAGGGATAGTPSAGIVPNNFICTYGTTGSATITYNVNYTLDVNGVVTSGTATSSVTVTVR
jgi:hypothetical protein